MDTRFKMFDLNKTDCEKGFLPNKLDYARFWESRDRLKFVYKQSLWLLFIRWFFTKERWRYTRPIPNYELVRAIYESKCQKHSFIAACNFVQDVRYPITISHPDIVCLPNGNVKLIWKYRGDYLNLLLKNKSLEMEFFHEQFLKFQNTTGDAKSNHFFDVLKDFQNVTINELKNRRLF